MLDLPTAPYDLPATSQACLLRCTRQAMLVDTFGRRHTYLRISLTERCNLRCVYCMPSEGVALTPRPHLLTTEEIIRLAALFVDAGVTKIRLTGGEPLVRKDIVAVAEALGGLPGLETLALTTNGVLLPRLLPDLHAAGVNALNLSLDSLRPDRFADISRRPGLDRVQEAIRLALAYGYEPLKINCVVMRGVNEDELVDFVALTEHDPIEIRFIEYMPFQGNGWHRGELVPWETMREIIEQTWPLVPLPGEAHDTARTFSVPGNRGRVGFIASMTAPFCEGCNRLRITADGNLKVCLFGKAEVSLRDALRAGATDDDLRGLIAAAVQRKKAAHAGVDLLPQQQNRPMILIGG